MSVKNTQGTPPFFIPPSTTFGYISRSLAKATTTLSKKAAKTAAVLQRQIDKGIKNTAGTEKALADLEEQIEVALQDRKDTRHSIDECRERWSVRWRDVQPDVGNPDDEAPAIGFDALAARESAFNEWRESQDAGHQRKTRWLGIQRQFSDRLVKPSASDVEQLRPLYVRHATVVGMTCHEAGRRDTYDQSGFEPYDVVIIDEVSKATAPELLLAMMLGRKVILIGDHRQLPPMFRERESSYAEAAAENQIDPDALDRHRKIVTSSHFQELFEAAPGALRHSLLTQYRMHPQIMGVVNHFYGGQLMAGKDADGREMLHQHHLTVRDTHGGLFLEPNQHVLWIDSTKDQRGKPSFEQQCGTSKANALEARLAVATLQRLNSALLQRGYGSLLTITVKGDQNGMPVRAWLEGQLTDAAPETVSDILARGRLRLNGRSVGPDDIVHTGDELEIDRRKSVGVITFYGAQCARIRSEIQSLLKADSDALSALDLTANTVDQFQGMECAIVLVSLVRAQQRLRGGEFVKQYQRINVALSRAQELLTIIGSAETFRDAMIDLPPMEGGPTKPVPVYRKIFEYVTHKGGRRHACQLLG